MHIGEPKELLIVDPLELPVGVRRGESEPEQPQQPQRLPVVPELEPVEK